MKAINENPRVILVLLWITVLFNMIFADILSIMVEFVDGGVVDIPIDVSTAMGIAAVLTNIPILMVLLSWVLPYRINRRTNIVAAALTILYVIAGGVLLPHYFIMGGVEVILLIIVIVLAMKWKPISFDREMES